ncbi:MAG: hypothetical protein OEV73_00100 [Desulfobulbaceae bacterium]|nr:hypothetical protein [Desulfobulbaceae bacterium]
MTTTLKTALDNLAVQITGNEPLQAFAQQQWGKNVAARISFRRRTEIHASELPLVLITCPSRGKRTQISGGIMCQPQVRLYFGFYQPKSELVVAEQLVAEELIEDAIYGDTGLGDTVDRLDITASSNDEGAAAPTCFTVIDLQIEFTRGQVDVDTLDDFLRTHTEWDMATPDGQIDAVDDLNIPQT